MVCGPKNSGKSTFAKLLINSLLTTSMAAAGVAFLDLDVGQPEFSPPGNISLFHLKSPIFGASFTHPLISDSSNNELIRAHFIGGVTPLDQHHYLRCVLDLFNRYQQMKAGSAACPLVINCSGWILGTGLETLESLVEKLFPTDIVYMSDKGPVDIQEALRQAAGNSKASFHQLAIQSAHMCSRATHTAADLRLMQTLSYFHLDECEENLRWDASPLNAVEPHDLYYAGPEKGLYGVIVLNEELDSDLLACLIEGSILGLAALEDEVGNPENHSTNYIGKGGQDIASGFQVNSEMFRERADFSGDEAGIEALRELSSEWSGHRTLLHSNPQDVEPQSNTQRVKYIIQDTKENLPYLMNGSGACIPLDPARSRCIGQVLVRGINVQKQALQILTPISEATFRNYRLNGVRLVLIKGKLENPNWAYNEEYMARREIQREKKRLRGYVDGQTGDGDSDEAGFTSEYDVCSDPIAHDIPWMKLATESRHRRHRVWKVRKHLRSRSDQAIT